MKVYNGFSIEAVFEINENNNNILGAVVWRLIWKKWQKIEQLKKVSNQKLSFRNMFHDKRKKSVWVIVLIANHQFILFMVKS